MTYCYYNINTFTRIHTVCAYIQYAAKSIPYSCLPVSEKPLAEADLEYSAEQEPHKKGPPAAGECRTAAPHFLPCGASCVLRHLKVKFSWCKAYAVLWNLTFTTLQL